MFWFTSFVLILAALSETIAFPNDIVKCKIDDADCLVKSASKVLRNHYEGIKEINFTSIDPLFVAQAKVVQDSGPVKVDSTSNNSSMRGLSKGMIEHFGGFERNLMEIKFKVPRLEFKGFYKARSTVLGIPISGGGPYKTIFENFRASIVSNLTRVEKDGKEYFKVVSVWMSFDTSDGEVDVPDLGFLINAFLNASFNLIKNALTPAVSEVCAQIFMETFNDLFGSVPINELFIQ